MKINQKILSRALTAVSGVADKKSPLEIAKNVLIEVKKDVATCRCTDTVTSISVRLPVESEAEWSTTVDAKLIADIAKVMPKNSDVEIENREEELKLILKTGKSSFDLLTLPAIDFPVGKDVSFETINRFDAVSLSSLISKTYFSMGTDTTRPNICSMLLEFEDTNVKSVTTDGHKMTVALCGVEHNAEENKSILVPSRCVQELKKLTGDSTGNVEVCYCDNEILFELSEELNDDGDEIFFEIRSKIVEQEFPPYEKVIPKSFGKTVEFKKSDMIESAKRLLIIVSEKRVGVAKLSLKDNELCLDASGAAHGSAAESIEAICDSEEGFEIGLNIQYLIDACSASTDDVLRLKLSGGLDPAMLEDDSDYKCIIMPMRI